MIRTSNSLRGLALLAASLALAPVAARAQSPGVVDLNPPTPPTATWPLLEQQEDEIGAPGTDFANVGTGRGGTQIDLLGPDPAFPGDPTKVGPPDGIPDVVLTNSNSPALPLGAPPPQWITPPVGTDHEPCVVYRGEPDGTYTDVTALLSPGDPNGFDAAYPGGSPWGVLAGDYDGDGDHDLYYPCGGFNLASPNTLLRNQGDGTFQNASIAAGLTENQVTFSAIWWDPDVDGDLDLFVTNSVEIFGGYLGPPDPDPTDRLHENQGDGTFVETAAAAELDLKSAGFACTSADFDEDGLPDLFVSCYDQYNKIFYNTPSGSFSFMAPSLSEEVQLDIDADLVPDPSHPGSVDFATVPPTFQPFLPVRPMRSMPAQAEDVNGDGWVDLVAAPWNAQVGDAIDDSALGAIFTPGETTRMYLNMGDQDEDGFGDGYFRDVSHAVGYDHVGGSMGQILTDLNGDGWLDMYVGGGGPLLYAHLEEDYLYVAEGDAWPLDFQHDPGQPLPKVYYELGALAGTYANIDMCHGVLARPRNGRTEILAFNGGPAVFDAGQKNVYWGNLGNADGSTYDTLVTALEPTISAPGAPGAEVRVIRADVGGPGQVVRRQHPIGFNFASYNGEDLAIPIGSEGALYVEVAWLSGVRQGRFLYPDPLPTGPIVMTEPTLSMGFDARHPSSGGVDFSIRIEELGQASHQGIVLLVSLHPLAPGAFVPQLTLVLGANVGVQPGQPWTFSATDLVGLPAGLYGAVYVDFGGAILAQCAAWHEPGLEAGASASDSAAGAPATPPRARWTSGARPTAAQPSAPRSTLRVARELELHSTELRLLDASGEGGPRALALAPPWARRFTDGTVVEWSGTSLRVTKSPTGSATLNAREDGLGLALGMPESCCATASDASPGEATVLWIGGVGGTILADGVPYSPRLERTGL